MIIKDDLDAVLLRLNLLPSEWRRHADRDGSALYRAGFEHCAKELDEVLEEFMVALDEWSRALVAGKQS